MVQSRSLLILTLIFPLSIDDLSNLAFVGYKPYWNHPPIYHAHPPFGATFPNIEQEGESQLSESKLLTCIC